MDCGVFLPAGEGAWLLYPWAQLYYLLEEKNWFCMDGFFVADQNECCDEPISVHLF